MKYLLKIQSGGQHLYNTIKLGTMLEIIKGGGSKIVKTSDQKTLDILCDNYIDRMYDEHQAFAKHYHRFGECLNIISDVQLNNVDWRGICSGCGQDILETIIEQFQTSHDLYEISTCGTLSIHEYTTGSTTCTLVMHVDNSFQFHIICDDLLRAFLNVTLYYVNVDTIYKTTITGEPTVYAKLPNLKTWVYNNNNNDMVRHVIEHGEIVDDIIHVLVPEYIRELYTFVDRYLNAVYTIQNSWRESRYNPEGALCKKWCAEIQEKWNNNEC